MKTTLALLLLTAIASTVESLRCYECTDCGERVGNPTLCSINQDVCLKVILGQHVVKRCAEDDICEMGKVERAATRVWNNIINLFNDVSRDAQYQYCCDSDYCNSSHKTLPSIVLLALPLILASFLSR